MLLPRLSQASTFAGHFLRKLPLHLRKRTPPTFLRSVSACANNNGLGSRSCVTSLFRLSSHTQRLTALGTAWTQQWRGMKTRSSVKRLCDGCKVDYELDTCMLPDQLADILAEQPVRRKNRIYITWSGFRSPFRDCA